MNIVGKGKKVIDADLLAKLAVDRQSAKTVSQAEVKKAIAGAVSDLKDDFSWRDSSRGLTRAARAITNTLQLAIDSGWVRGNTAKDLIKAFVEGEGGKSLDSVLDDIKADIKDNRDSSVGYGGGSSSVSYGGGYSTGYSGT
jgi:hypothetical protein